MQKKGKLQKYFFKGLFTVLDIILLPVFIIGYYYFDTSTNFATNYFFYCLIFIAAYSLAYCLLRLHKCVWAYASFSEYIKLTISLLFATCFAHLAAVYFLGLDSGFFATFAVAFFVSFGLKTISRIAARQKIVRKNLFVKQKNTLIIGGGWTGSMLIKEFLNNVTPYKPICIIDDDEVKINKEIMQVPVVGDLSKIEEAVQKFDIKSIFFAIPSCRSDKRSKILSRCLATNCEVKAIPHFYEYVQTGTILSQSQNVKMEDLLGRITHEFDAQIVRDYVLGKVCLVTGGGGSIGSELCRQIAACNPKMLVIVDIYENTTYEIQTELKTNCSELDLAVEICSVSDCNKMEEIFIKYKPQLIFHAAAHKHVPLMESVPEQAVKNNVRGTFNICGLASKYGAERMILISTDKAVNPTNVMGATKRCCEMIVNCFGQHSATTRFCAVRFGNVLGSNGSVIPLFAKQIQQGGPVTVTHKDVVRYFMIIPEAVSLVLQAGALGRNGEVYVLDMGEPVRIVTLAENMIRMMGLKPYEDIEIRFIGLRPGEKLFEELLLSEEETSKTELNKIFIGKQADVDSEKFIKNLNELLQLADQNLSRQVVDKLKEIIPNFNHSQTFAANM